MSDPAKTMFEKVWEQHEVVPQTGDTPAVLYIDLHLTHEVTTPQAFTVLRERGLRVRRTDLTLATMDHSTPTRTEQVFGGAPITIDSAAKQIRQLEQNCADFGVELLGLQHQSRGIVHVIGPELGVTQPGKTVVCGDSHTSTHGAFGALAFGIGSTEVAHVLATQCLLQSKPRTLAVNVSGRLRPGVTAKDLILGIIGKLGVAGGTGYVIEYRGEAIRAMDMDERMTVCNMSIEAGARAGMIAPDETTFAYLKNTPARAEGRRLGSRRGALEAAAVRPGREVRQGNRHRCLLARADDHVRHESGHGDSDHRLRARAQGRCGVRQIARLHGLRRRRCHPRQAGERGVHRQLHECASVGPARRRRSAARAARSRAACRCWSCRARRQIKRAAEAEGLDRVFIDAGAEWRESGCSMCLGMNGDLVGGGQYSVSTSNRNFEGRQGVGARTLLASPLTAAASAVRGRVTDPRELLAS